MATKRLYRSREGKVFGVCQGIADWKELPVDVLRLIVGISILVTGLFPGILIYAGIALFLPLEPRYAQEQSSRGHKEDLSEMFERLKRRVQGMEEEIFDKERDWDQRFYDGE
ncbi:MAG: PspC domain-containing protein [Sphaerochaetaceae bacterium]|jgi:phage shock protein C|nr:PspC domain-containing protein [Sphaerochaetaceae bacterium]HHU88698.1 PspC domain-containing protein [Spirochaetales bacterium]